MNSNVDSPNTGRNRENEKSVSYYRNITGFVSGGFALPGCAEKDVRPLYTVTFISAEGETVKTDKVRRGDEVDAPEQQQRPGYTAYWADEEGNRTAFPKIVTGDETYYLKYSPSLVKDAYITEYYFENDDGQFLIDDSLTKSYDMPLNTVVRIYPGQFDGYEFDENNRFNVLSGTTQPGVTVTLRAYYRQNALPYRITTETRCLKAGKWSRERRFRRMQLRRKGRQAVCLLVFDAGRSAL